MLFLAFPAQTPGRTEEILTGGGGTKEGGRLKVREWLVRRVNVGGTKPGSWGHTLVHTCCTTSLGIIAANWGLGTCEHVAWPQRRFPDLKPGFKSLWILGYPCAAYSRISILPSFCQARCRLLRWFRPGFVLPHIPAWLRRRAGRGHPACQEPGKQM